MNLKGKLSRRSFIQIAGTVSGAAVLAGCSSSSDSGNWSYAPELKYEETKYSSACLNNCANGCRLFAHVRNGRLVKTSMAPMPDTRYNRVCLRGLSHMQRLYSPERIKTPMKRVSGERGNKNGFISISWEDAVREISEKFTKIMNDAGDAKGRALAYISGSGNFGTVHGLYTGGYSRLFNALGASKVGASLDLNVAQGYAIPFGTPGALCTLQNQPSDLARSKTIILWGTNLGSAHIQTWHHAAEARDNNNAQIISVDIMLSNSAARSDKFVCLRPGSDTFFALSMLHYIITNDLVDKPFMFKNTVANLLVNTATGKFVKKFDLTALEADKGTFTAWKGGALEYTTPHPTLTGKQSLSGTYGQYTFEHSVAIDLGNGIFAKTAYQMLIDFLTQPYSDTQGISIADFSGVNTESITGVSHQVAEVLAQRYASAEGKPASITSGFGPDHRTNGHHTYHALGTLAAVTGNFGKPGGGVGVCEVMTPYLNGGPINTAANGMQSAPSIPYPVFKDVFDSENPISSVDHFGNNIAVKPFGGADELFRNVPTKIRGLFIAYSNLVTNFCQTGDLIGENGIFTKKVNGTYKMETIVVAETEWTDTAIYADYVLPACHWFEREDYNGFGSHPFAVYQEKALEPMWESLPDREIAIKLAKGLGLESEFTQTHDEIFDLSLDPVAYTAWHKGMTGYEPAPEDLPTPARLRQEKVIRVIPGRDVDGQKEYIYPMWRVDDDLRIDSFGGSGRIEFYSDMLITFSSFGQDYEGTTLIINPLLTKNEQLPVPEVPYEGWHRDTVYNSALRAAGYTLNNFSQRIRWRVHTQWWNIPWIRELEPYPVVYVSPYDVAGTGIKTGNVIKVSNPRGSYKGRAIITPGIQPGMIDAPRGWQRWQYSEFYGENAGSCNDVTSRKVHPVSACQSFFDALVKIEKVEG